MVTSLTVNAEQVATQTFQSQQSFTQKLLQFTFTLAQNTQNPQPSAFSGTGQQITISGVRARCRIYNSGPPAGARADILIWGLSQSLLNQLTSLNADGNQIFGNSILVGAGASTNSNASAASATTSSLSAAGLPIVFGGTIYFSIGLYDRMPDVPLYVIAQGGLIAAVQSVAPSSYTGQTSIVTIMKNFAAQLGVAFENNGCTQVLSKPYYPGTIMQQIYRAAFDAGINAQLVDGGTKLAIWPIGGSRFNAGGIPLVSPATGMIGYPALAPTGWLTVKTLFNPSILFGGNIQVQSSIPQANKTWTVRQLDLALDTLMPGGDWMMTAHCSPQQTSSSAAGVPPPVLQ